MRIPVILSICVISTSLWTCQNIEDATPSNRGTFFKLYEAPYSTVATDIELTPTGFVVLGNMSVDEDSVVTVVFTTDKQGNRTSEFVPFSGGVGNSIRYFSNNALTGYIIIGDSIKSDPSSSIVANIDVASARILILDESLALKGSRSLSDTTLSDNNPYIADYYGETVTVTDDGRIILLGTYREGVATQIIEPAKPFIFALTNDLKRDWVQKYDLINRNYSNGRSLHYFNDQIVWTSSISRVQTDNTFSYVSIPVIQNQSIFVNNSLLGETSDQLFESKDIQPAKNPTFGFGVTGTYSLATDGSQGNIFFLKTDLSGNIIPSSVKYFDAIGSSTGEAVESDASQIEDRGEAIATTSDGGYAIVGTFVSNSILGKGEKDIVLIKLDAIGNVQWMKNFGGIGDEDVVSIIETDDKGLLVCGSSTIGTYTTTILIKTDKNGELKD